MSHDEFSDDQKQYLQGFVSGAELGRAVLSIAQLNHVNETAAVRDVVANVLGDVPDVWT